jgi:ppGpp synthetase/RelA/SpoT-type nucleotidyltranferase
MIPAKLTIWRANLEQDLDALRGVIEPKLIAALQGLNVEAITVRKKQAKSIHQKLLAGKLEDVKGWRDLLGLTVVVLYRNEIPKAIEFLKASDLIVDDPGPIEVGPSDFRYHEPKVFVRPPQSYLDRHPLLVEECEIQFTTVLQHALDAATHDFDYKGRNYSWSNFRLVAQMRGILEMIDRTIDDIDSVMMPTDPTVATPQPMVDAAVTIEILATYFPDRLPEDRRRLADTVGGWLTAAQMTNGDLQEALSVHADLVAAQSLDATSAVLGVILRHAPGMVGRYKGLFFVSDELRTLCTEAAAIPSDRTVTGI